MAKFQLYLLNMNSSSETTSFKISSKIPISIFKTEVSQYEDNLNSYWNNFNDVNTKDRQTATISQQDSFCYTYDEKFQIHQNTQRTLTFSMNKDIIRDDRIEKNPFINYLYIGAQLLLVDKYDKHHLLTVTKINYEFHPMNTVFKYECQDSFNYQLSRQNAGYEIENDPNSSDFIGAKNLDWWVYCKIQPECSISYSYLSLTQQKSFTQQSKTYYIKKDTYSAEQYPEFHRTISFSASGTANSVLIALGEQYGLQLQVYERLLDDNTLLKYYWFTPKKSLRPTGLKYSPNYNIQSFGLEHVGAAFSSVLNVQNHNVGDEILTMIPSVPAFFRRWFETQDWKDSIFTTGLFSSACTEKIQYWEVSETVTSASLIHDKQNQYIYIPIPQQIVWDLKYDEIKFITNDGLYSIISFGDESYLSKYQKWKIGYFNEDNFIYISAPSECVNITPYIQLKYTQETTPDFLIAKIYLSQCREPTTEELEFATIADQVPWLENRLVDFKYFYDHSIINLQQYHKLLSIFENDLRKANAKVLLYSQLYYQSIQAKTKILSTLSSKIDLVGATFNAELIKPFQTDGRVKTTTDFVLAMSDLFKNNIQTVELIDYHETLGDYINKYFNAEQSFLKNIYLFRQYFYEGCGLGNLYNYKWELAAPNNDTQVYYSFENQFNKYIKLTTSNFNKNIFIQTTDANQHKQYTPFDKNKLVTMDNYTTHYYLDPFVDNYVLISNDKPQYQGWNKEATYYELQWETNDTSLMNEFKDKTGQFNTTVLFGTDGTKKYRLELVKNNSKVRISCYQHCLHTTEENDSEAIISIGPNDYDSLQLENHRVWAKTNLTEMKINYFYQTLIETGSDTQLKDKKFIHTHITDEQSLIAATQPAEEWKTFYINTNEVYTPNLGLNKQILQYISNSKNWPNNRLENDEEVNKVYAESFPLSLWYYYGKIENEDNERYHEIPFVNIENHSTFMRRISVATENRAAVLGATDALTRSDIITKGLVNLICHWIWKYGDKGFGNEGWTYQDVFGTPDITAFQSFYSGNSIVYTPSESLYNAATDDNTNTVLDQLKESWDINQANGLLFTFNSYLHHASQITNNQYHYKPVYWRILNENDIISSTGTYQIIVLKDSSQIADLSVIEKFLPTASDNRSIKRLDSLVYYPLANLMTKISGKDFDWSNITETTATLKSLGYSNNTSDHYWLSNSSNTSKIILIQEEQFIYQDFSSLTWADNSINYDNIAQIARGTYFDNSTLQKFDIVTECLDLTNGYYITGYEDSDYIQFKYDSSIVLDNYEIYHKNGPNNFTRVYTKNQLINRIDSYVRTDNTYGLKSFSEVDELKLPCYKYKKTEENEFIFDGQFSGKIIKKDGSFKLYVEDQIINLISNESEPDFHIVLDNLSNAEFWYTYRNDSSDILKEKAMLIETNLMEYWTNAYYASKNCKYFLPEFWQTTVDQTINYYSASILTPRFSSGKLLSLELSTAYVPVVTKIPQQHKFHFRHETYVNESSSMEQRYNLPTNEVVSLSEIMEATPAIYNTMQYLGILEQQQEWSGVSIKNDYVLYEHKEGGQLWTQELQRLSGNLLNYPNSFGGWYDMMVKVLLSCNYSSYTPTLYTLAQEEHNQIWAQLYSQYSHLLLEQSYTNENASTSEELLRAAQYALCDLTQVESNYNIVVIDPWTLKNYQGQDLQIGDGIEVNAQEIYDDHDSDIYKSLIQYLYITDINYDLRRDDNIQLTVNSIKYQDKVIGELVKLIR